jgi:four helix bundle protein
MTPDEMKARTKAFALRVIKIVDSLPGTTSARVLGGQLVRCGTSVGANYRAVRRAKSSRDFINKLKIVEEEADESVYWLELIAESGMIKPQRLAEITREANEITAIIVATIKRARENE